MAMRRRFRQGPSIARPTRQKALLSDVTYVVFDDGSWRRQFPKIRGKAQVKRLKRKRQQARYATWKLRAPGQALID